MRNNSFILVILIGKQWTRVGQMENIATKLSNNLLYFIQQGFIARIDTISGIDGSVLNFNGGK